MMSYRVLIVDDSPAMRSFIRRVMDLSGFDVGEYLQAADGVEALEVLTREHVDVILTDINMPRMNGEELVRKLEANDALRSIPVMVVSTDGTESRINHMASLGTRAYLKKPFLPETLREALERVLGVAQ
jgi:two-component system chemotaxis response regulator CheY